MTDYIENEECFKVHARDKSFFGIVKFEIVLVSLSTVADFSKRHIVENVLSISMRVFVWYG